MEAEGLGLVADIGRITIRFGLSGGAAGSGLHHVRQMALSDYPTFTDALLAYLGTTAHGGSTMRSVLAVAGAARGDVINLTGSRWYISRSGVEAVLRGRATVINECAAAALALTTLRPGDMRALTSVAARPVLPSGSYLIVAPRTGLGFAALVGDGDRLAPVQSEAGHMRFAPETPDEAKVAAAIERRGGIVSLEAVLSSGGLSTIHAVLANRSTVLAADEIVKAAPRDPVAAEAIRLYSGALGSALGDLVLAFGAWDGVLLNGAFARRIGPLLSTGVLTQRMQAKDAFRRQLSQTPVSLVLPDDLELQGAAVALAA